MPKHEVADRVLVKLSAGRIVEAEVKAITESTDCTLNQMLDLKDLNTGLHSTRLAS